ncbi:helix-turn-helix domain-containing protein [Alkalihalobacillus sp. TS-13]|uniref:helix-turn-helix domain-containing protein n=1 Tax=Alkalihalobacillus sp. TS-13 TaxID=2842455 RepID=UPI001C87E780|nr:helix-turn-helix transcriptional regulator [Alkalihalobacillus sp. TS-13]
MSVHINERIKKQRELKGWSQRELARRININSSVMNRIELGTRPVEDHEIKLIANILEVSTDYLLCETDDPTPREKANESTACHEFQNLTENEKEYLGLQLELFRKIKDQN